MIICPLLSMRMNTVPGLAGPTHLMDNITLSLTKAHFPGVVGETGGIRTGTRLAGNIETFVEIPTNGIPVMSILCMVMEDHQVVLRMDSTLQTTGVHPEMTGSSENTEISQSMAVHHIIESQK